MPTSQIALANTRATAALVAPVLSHARHRTSRPPIGNLFLSRKRYAGPMPDFTKGLR